MKVVTYSANDEQATEQLGAVLASALPDGTVVALIGTLGAGKTRLVRAVGHAAGVRDEEIASPTFVLLHEYAGDRPLFHFDAYRLRDVDEFLDLGPDAYFESAGLTFVEWGDRVMACLPRDHIAIHIDVTGPESREFRLSCSSGSHEPVIEEIASRLRAL